MINSNKYTIRQAPPQQGGFSLIELMVAVLIGLFLTLGLSQVFISMYSTSQSQSTLFQYQTNQRQAVTALTNSTVLAGYFAQTPTSTSYAQIALPAATNSGDGTTFTAGAGIVGTTGGTVPQQDTLDIYYQSSGTDNIYNCQGGVTPVTSPVVTYTTVINSFSINASSQLVCTVSVAGATPTTPLVLATNIKNMTILYAIDTTASTATPLYTTDTFMTASQVSTAGDWSDVRAVQITLNFCAPNVINTASTACSTTIPWVQTINLMGKS
jgi:type IV pilus assembly protein PilW